MEKKEVYNTREDVFHVMDAELSEEEKKEVIECEDISDLHFSLGVYIRNRFLYGDVKNDVLSLFDYDDSNVIIAPDGTKFRFNIGHPDMWWEFVAEGYKEYLLGQSFSYFKKGLSKSKLTRFFQCPKSLWLKEYMPEEELIDSSAESRLETGHKVGELAKSLFGEFVDVTTLKDDGSLDIKSMIEQTDELVANETNVICEAAFSFKQNYCAVDLLVNKGSGYAIYEVKSSSSNNPSNLYYVDIAYQKWVLEHCGINVTGTYLICINSDYILEGELDIQKFFHVFDVAEEITEYYECLDSCIPEAHSILEQTEEPYVELSYNCKGCSFFEHCFGHLSSPNVFQLYGMRFDKKLSLFKQGKVSFNSLDSVKLTEKQKRQVDCYLNDSSHIDKSKIRDFLSQLSYPIYFLDFETTNPAIPMYEGTHPYQQVVFQYSLHYINKEGGELLHKEFLAESGENPTRKVAEQLCKDIPMNVSVTAYNKEFECGRTRELAALFPDLADHLLNIADNIVDLLVPFQKGMYYVPAMGGSFSIKSVLPALFPDDPTLDYHNLEGDVHNGSEAMNIFPLIKDMSAEKQMQARQSLLKYCELDTYAMVKVWQKLCEV